MNRFVLDCSVSAAWCLQEAGSETAEKILGLTACDAAYLELAMRNRLPLATLDDGLRRAANKAGVALLS